MKHRNLWITLIVIALIAVAYGSAAWYFSNLIIASDTESLAEAAADIPYVLETVRNLVAELEDIRRAAGITAALTPIPTALPPVD